MSASLTCWHSCENGGVLVKEFSQNFYAPDVGAFNETPLRIALHLIKNYSTNLPRHCQYLVTLLRIPHFSLSFLTIPHFSRFFLSAPADSRRDSLRIPANPLALMRPNSASSPDFPAPPIAPRISPARVACPLRYSSASALSQNTEFTQTPPHPPLNQGRETTEKYSSSPD